MLVAAGVSVDDACARFAVVIDASLIDGVLDELVARLAPAVAAELASRLELPAAEEWRLLDLEEAAARVGRSATWLRKRARAGEVPFVRLDGGALGFELADLQALAAAHRVDASAGTLAVLLQQAHGARNGAGLRGGRQPRGLRVERG